jgi:hypothetical protein
VRFIVLHARTDDKLTLGALRDVSQLLDDESLSLADEYPARTTELKKVFTATFDFIASHGADKVFRRWNAERQAGRFHAAWTCNHRGEDQRQWVKWQSGAGGIRVKFDHAPGSPKKVH